jgi:hypothetical protein
MQTRVGQIMALRFSINTNQGKDFMKGLDFHPLKAGKTLHPETLKCSNLSIAYTGLLPGLQRMNTKCGKTLNWETLNQDSTVFRTEIEYFCFAFHHWNAFS